MARAIRCPCCGHYMFAVHRDRHRGMTWLNYVCRNHACKKCRGKCRHWEKQFIDRQQPHPKPSRT